MLRTVCNQGINMKATLDGDIFSTNSTVDSEVQCETCWVQTFSRVIGIFTLLLSIGLNLPVLCVVIRMKPRRPSYVLVGNLAAADLLVGIVLVVQLLPAPSIKYSCLVAISLIVLSWLCSFLGTLIIASDRLLVVLRPLRHKALVTTKRVFRFLGLMWVLGAVWAFLPTFGLNVWFEGSACNFYVLPLWYVLATASWYVLVMVITAGLYVFLFYSYRKDAHITRKMFETHRSMSQESEREHSIRLAKALLLVTCAFVVCWTPFTVLSVFTSVGLSKYYDWISQPDVWRTVSVAYVLTYSLAMWNSALNPCLYAWKMNAIRDGFLAMIPVRCRRIRTTESAQEMKTTETIL